MLTFDWINNGDWTGLCFGALASNSSLTVSSNNSTVIIAKIIDGSCSTEDSIQIDDRFYKVSSVVSTTVTLAQVPHRPLAYDEQLQILHKAEFGTRKTLIDVLRQLGYRTCLVQWLYLVNTNLRQQNMAGSMLRFYYPERHRTIWQFLQLLTQTCRAYATFPQVVFGINGEPYFISDLNQMLGEKLWQLVDKKRGEVLSISNGRMTTVPCVQTPCLARANNNTFAIGARLQDQWYQVIQDPAFQRNTTTPAIDKGHQIEFSHQASSMDWWSPIDEQQTFGLATRIVNNEVIVEKTVGQWEIHKQVTLANRQYRIENIRGTNALVHLTLYPIPDTLGPITQDVTEKTGFTAMPLVEKDTGRYLDFEYRTPVVFECLYQDSNRILTIQKATGTISIGDIFVVNETICQIIGVLGNVLTLNIDLPRALQLGEQLVISKSRIKLAANLKPNVGTYFFGMSKPHLQVSNAGFNVKEWDNVNLTYIVEAISGWEPATVITSGFCNRIIYLKDDWQHHNEITRENLLEILYRLKRILDGMWFYLNRISSELSLDTVGDWYTSAVGEVKNDPYWGLFLGA